MNQLYEMRCQPDHTRNQHGLEREKEYNDRRRQIHPGQLQIRANKTEVTKSVYNGPVSNRDGEQSFNQPWLR